MKRSIRKFMGMLSIVAVLVAALAVAAVAAIPAKPEGNSNLITGDPVIPTGAASIYSYASGKLSVPGQPGSTYYADYPLDASLTAEDSYVISVEYSIPASGRYDEYMGPMFIFRKNTDGNYLGLWMQGNATYCGTFTKADDGQLSFTPIGSIDNCLPDGTSGTLKIYSTPTKVTFSVYDANGTAQTLTYNNGAGTIGTEHGWDVSGGAPAFGVASKGTTIDFANAEVYDTVPAPTTTTTEETTTTTEETTTTTEQDEETTTSSEEDVTTTTVDETTTTAESTTTTQATTTTTKAPVDARPTAIPSTKGLKDLIGNNTAFRSAFEGYTYKDGVLKAIHPDGIVVGREFGRFDLSGVKESDTYLISLKMKVNSHHDEYSGCYIGFRGKDGKDFLAMGFQTNQVYLMDYVSNDYASGSSFKVMQGANFTLKDGQEYQIDIFSTPTKVSLFVDGVLTMDYVTVETHAPMLSVLSANSTFELSNVALYNLSAAVEDEGNDSQGGSTTSPGTGAMAPVAAVCALMVAAAGITTLCYRRRSTEK